MGAEIRRIISGSIEFSAINRELSIPLDIDSQSDLVDIKLQMYCAPTAVPLIDSAKLTGGEDFRVYINDHNITAQIIEELKANLEAVDHETLKSSYLKGAKSYNKLIRTFKSFSIDADQDWEFAKTYAVNNDWSEKIKQLGDRTAGWSGNMHCFNYLYRFMPIKPISVNQAWKAYLDSSQGDQTKDLSDFPHLVITFSEGPAPAYEEIDPEGFIPSGRLVYQLELLHKNPLEPRLRQIASRLKTVSRQLEDQRHNYLSPIKSGVETANEDIVAGNKETKKAVDKLTISVSNIN